MATTATYDNRTMTMQNSVGKEMGLGGNFSPQVDSIFQQQFSEPRPITAPEAQANMPIGKRAIRSDAATSDQG